MLSEVYSDILDARLVGVVQAPDQRQAEALDALIHRSDNWLDDEAYQDYAVVLDVDGGRPPAGVAYS
jgi:hypothetical protein